MRFFSTLCLISYTLAVKSENDFPNTGLDGQTSGYVTGLGNEFYYAQEKHEFGSAHGDEFDEGILAQIEKRNSKKGKGRKFNKKVNSLPN